MSEFDRELAAVQDALENHSARIQVRGDSMRPLLQSGDRVWVEALREPLAVGQLVLLARGGWVIHRIVAVGNTTVETRGDACLRSDQPWKPAEVIGRVVARERVEGQRVSLPTPNRALRLLLRLRGFLTRALWPTAPLHNPRRTRRPAGGRNA